MLELKKVTKLYSSGVEALKGIDIKFRKSEFVSILGQSGCGKTTLLNIIGGLDRYTSGDLVINGKSTKEFKDKDWDAYRNYSIGFVFQSYNLIPHQSVLSNVELALTLSGVSKNERRNRAIKALEDVGLKEQINKRPNELSGGQMQRVAIARALVNNPDIILADEPTGALDTKTSVQIMEILKKISKDKLIIMVTHNPDLAEKYSSRIIKVLDGVVTDDSNPYDGKDEEKLIAKDGKTSMSFFTALALSLNNLMTKKGRTLLTSFAGSIGIIGIALILSLSNGVQNYIMKVQEDTLSSYPLVIQESTIDIASMMESMMGINDEEDIEYDKEKIYSAAYIMPSGKRFSTPKGITAVKVELETIPAKLPSPYTPEELVETHYFISGTEPTEMSTRFSQLSDPTKLKVVENGSKATLTWTGTSIPDAVNPEYLTNYFNSGYKDWAQKYYDKRIEYNNNVIGTFGYDIYLKSGSNLTYVGHTSETNYTIDNTTGYDSIVVKSAYSKFKSNASNGVEVNLTGTSTTFKVALIAVEASDGEVYLNPTYKIGSTIPDLGLSTIKFLVNDVDMTDSISNSDKQYIIRDCTTTCKTVTNIDTSEEAEYQITYTINYLGTPYKETRYVHIKKEIS